MKLLLIPYSHIFVVYDQNMNNLLSFIHSRIHFMYNNKNCFFINTQHILYHYVYFNICYMTNNKLLLSVIDSDICFYWQLQCGHGTDYFRGRRTKNNWLLKVAIITYSTWTKSRNYLQYIRHMFITINNWCIVMSMIKPSYYCHINWSTSLPQHLPPPSPP